MVFKDGQSGLKKGRLLGCSAYEETLGQAVEAGVFGFTGVASGARSISKTLFFIAIAFFLIVLVFGVFLGKLVF